MVDTDTDHNDSQELSLEHVRRRLQEIGVACIALATNTTEAPPHAAVRGLGRALIELTGAIDRYPDTPMYRRLLDVTEIPDVEPLDPNAVAPLYVISDTQLYSPDTERTVTLSGDELWAFNAFAMTRHGQLRSSEHLAYGFRPMRANALYQAYRHAVGRLESELTSILPPDTPVILTSEMSSRQHRQLNPNITIADMRGDEAYARTANPTTEMPTVPINVSKIAALSGASRDQVRKRLRAIYGDEAYDALGKGREFPPEVTGPLIAELRAERGDAIVPLPAGHVRVRTLVLQSGRRRDVGLAVQILQQHGYHPVKLNLDVAHSKRGGVWVVEEEGALEILRTRSRIPLPEPAPVPPEMHSPPVTEPEPPLQEATDLVTPEATQAEEVAQQEAHDPTRGLRTTNTAAEIIAYLAAHEITVDATQILSAAITNPLIDPASTTKDSYSFYAAKKIIAALGGPTPDFIK